MASGDESGSQDPLALDTIQGLLPTLFSWVLLLPIAVIISGKLVGRRVRLGLDDKDLFAINIGIFRISARGDEVTLGFALFLLTLGVVVMAGGAAAYAYFEARAGVDIGHWNSLCVISSFFSVVSATLWYVIAPLLQRAPIISPTDRQQQIDKLKDSEDDAP